MPIFEDSTTSGHVNSVDKTALRSWLSYLSTTLPFASIFLCGAVSIAYLIRPDALAAITVFPPWVWSIPGIGGVWIARKRAPMICLAVGLVWMVFLIGFMDRPAALIGLAYRHFPDDVCLQTLPTNRVRVVTLNCGNGGITSAREAMPYKPNFIFLQESPGPIAVAKFAREAFGDRGEYLDGGDAALVACGDVIRTLGQSVVDHHSVQARIRLANGIELEAVSLRLEPAIVRIDLWSPDCWKSQSENRQIRRGQIDRIIARVGPVDSVVPLIVGGDFNAPSGDRIFEALAPRLRDSFAEAGLGWGNTITNIGPFARIDQVWISDHWSARTVISRKTVHSDHRMVVADLVLRVNMAVLP